VTLVQSAHSVPAITTPIHADQPMRSHHLAHFNLCPFRPRACHAPSACSERVPHGRDLNEVTAKCNHNTRCSSGCTTRKAALRRVLHILWMQPPVVIIFALWNGCLRIVAKVALQTRLVGLLGLRIYRCYSDCTSTTAIDLIRVMDKAASEGHLEVVKWLHAHRSEGCSSYAMNLAASNGHLEVLRWLHRSQTEGWTTRTMDYAAAGGHLDIVKWLYESRTEKYTVTAMTSAACTGHVDVLRWLVEHTSDKCRDDLMTTAGWRGHLGVVRYLDENTTQVASACGWGLPRGKAGWIHFLC
jgi:hypothetical protein